MSVIKLISSQANVTKP